MRGSRLVEIRRPLPLTGHIAFGILDRGTNVLQVRVTTLCPLSCIFCSVDAGPRTRMRATEYIVTDIEWLQEWVARFATLKGGGVEALLDGVGDPLSHPRIAEIVEALKKIPGVSAVALETHGYHLTKNMVDRLWEAGLDRVNLSIDSLDPELARRLARTPGYDVARVVEAAEYLVKETEIDLHIAPVWLPGVNDREIERIVEWGTRIGAGKRWPPFGIQKYVAHKYGRKPRGVREVSWDEFYRWLDRLGEKLGVNLRPRSEDFGIRPAPRVPPAFNVGEHVKLDIVLPGWLRGEVIGVPLRGAKVLVTVVGASRIGLEVGDRVLVKITSNKDGIYLAKPY